MTNEELAKLTAGFRSAVEAMGTASTALLTGLSSLAEDEDDDLDAQANAAAEEARAAVLAKRGAKDPVTPPVQQPAGRSQEEKNQVAGLRAACKKRGLEAEFEALEASGAPIADLRNVLVAGLRTSKTEIDGVQTPPADAKGKRGKLAGWDESTAKPGK